MLNHVEHQEDLVILANRIMNLAYHPKHRWILAVGETLGYNMKEDLAGFIEEYVPVLGVDMNLLAFDLDKRQCELEYDVSLTRDEWIHLLEYANLHGLHLDEALEEIKGGDKNNAKVAKQEGAEGSTGRAEHPSS